MKTLLRYARIIAIAAVVVLGASLVLRLVNIGDSMTGPILEGYRRLALAALSFLILTVLGGVFYLSGQISLKLRPARSRRYTER